MNRCEIKRIPIGRGCPVRLMGVINCSPESFYQGSYVQEGLVRSRAEEMIGAGADLIDIGARSTAPGSPPVSTQVEVSRLHQALTELDGSGIPVSVDTMHPVVVEHCLGHDVHAANDISGLVNPRYAQIVADAGLPAILMASHQGPGDSTTRIGTVSALQLVVMRCADAGITNYVLDPGIGLWTQKRTTALDWELCSYFEEFARFDHPLLAAVSRKTFLGEPRNRPPESRLAASLGLTALLITKGADIIRTHDIPETADVIRTVARVIKR